LGLNLHRCGRVASFFSVFGRDWESPRGFCRHVATYIKEREWHPSQQLREEDDGRLEMRIETSGRKELIRWILSWTPDVEVLAPEELKTRIAEKLRQGLETAVSSCPPILA
jgi:hypothetical protein